MLNTAQKSLLRADLLEMKSHLTKTENETDINVNAQETSGELSMYANHPGDLGTELFDREKNMAINIHANSELEKINQALEALKNNNYGKCQKCGEEIPFERLKAVPYTTMCVIHANDNQIAKDRPIEEEILKPPHHNSFSKKEDGRIRDFQDSFKEAAQDGTSETPSDFIGDYDNYDALYDKADDGMTK